MKLIFSNEHLFAVENVKNLLAAQGIEVMIKNEYAQGAIGEISAFDAWPEAWLVNEADFQRADEIVKASQESRSAADWICNHCQEINAASFDICWQCQHEAG